MFVRKIKGENKISKIIMFNDEVALVRKMGIPLEDYVHAQLLRIAKKRKWAWYLKKEKTDETDLPVRHPSAGA